MLRCALKAVAATACEIWLTYGCCARTGRVLCRMWCQCLARQWKGTPRAARSEADARPAGPGRASSRRAERSSRRGRRAGGQASRRPEIWRGSGGGRRSGGAAAAAGDLAGQRRWSQIYRGCGRPQIWRGYGQHWKTKGKWGTDTKNRRPVGHRLSVRHGGLEPSTR